MGCRGDIRRLLPPLAVGLLVSALAGCQRAPQAYEYHATPVEGWEPGDTLSFRVDSVARAGNYRLSVGVRTSAAHPFPFRVLWLEVKQRWPEAGASRTDTLPCRLVTEEGNLAGRGVSLYQYSFPVCTLSLPQGAHGRVTVRHIMRSEMLPGVSDVGIFLQEID